MHAGFEQFKAFDQDAVDDKAFLAHGKLPMPVLAVGGAKSFGPQTAEIMRLVATNVEQGYRAQLRTLDHGGESGGDDHVGDRLPRQVRDRVLSSAPAAASAHPPPVSNVSRE